MPQWYFDITDEAESDLNHLDVKTRKRILEKLKWFVNHFDHLAPLPLGGKWKGFFKLRVGAWDRASIN